MRTEAGDGQLAMLMTNQRWNVLRPAEEHHRSGYHHILICQHQLEPTELLNAKLTVLITLVFVCVNNDAVVYTDFTFIK